MSLHLEIVTPDSLVLNTDVDYVGAPGVGGEFGVLPGHVPLLSALSIGALYYKQGNQTHWAFVAGGFAEVSDDKVSILAEAAELSDDIDVDRAQAALERARARLDEARPEVDQVRAQASLARAMSRINIRNR